MSIKRPTYDSVYKLIDFKARPFGYSWDYFNWRKGKLAKGIISNLNFINGEKLLDNGGGFGYLRQFLPENVKYVNFDYSKIMLFYDNASNGKVNGVSEHLPFKNDSFRYLTSVDVLEHVHNKSSYLEEVFRVLKKGGQFVLTTPRTDWKKSYLKSPFLFWMPILGAMKSTVVLIFNLKKNIEFIGKLFNIAGLKKTYGSPVDIPSDINWLKDKLESIGFKIEKMKLVDNRPFSFTSSFWRKFADRFINEDKYGHCVMFVCSK